LRPSPRPLHCPMPLVPPPPRAAARDVQAVLKAFDGAREWPDVMKCITRLQRALEAKKHERFPDVPDKLSVGKRLAQCLHPSLPAGIHLTALDVYQPGPTGPLLLSAPESEGVGLGGHGWQVSTTHAGKWLIPPSLASSVETERGEEPSVTCLPTSKSARRSFSI